MRRIVSRLALLSVVAALLVLAQPASSQSDITITDLGPVCSSCSATDLNNQGHVVGFDSPLNQANIQFRWTPETGRTDLGGRGKYHVYVNDRGQVVGTNYISGAVQAVLWEGSEVTLVGDLEWQSAMPRDINEVGHVAGEGTNAEGHQRGFRWTPQKGVEDLGTLPGGTFVRPVGANDLGWVVGEATAAVGEGDAFGYAQLAFVWTPQNGMRDLGTLGGSFSRAQGVNNLGQVVGYSATGMGEVHAFLWTAEGGMTDIGTLGGMVSIATDINELGHIVGWGNTSTSETHAFLWTPEGGMQDLGPAPGDFNEWSRISVNDSDQVVGTSWVPTGGCLAFLWTQAQGMRVLDPLPGHQNSAVADINNEGQILGWSQEGTSERHMVLWTVDPQGPEDRLAALISEISELVDNGVLNKGQGNALIQKLENALRMLVQEKSPATCGQLQAFINQVEAYTKTGALPEDIGLELIYTANTVIGEVCG